MSAAKKTLRPHIKERVAGQSSLCSMVKSRDGMCGLIKIR